MATLNIVMKGIALILKEREEWKIFMPFDRNCHNVNLGFFRGDYRYTLKGPGRRVSVTAMKKNPRAPIDRPSTGSNYNSIFNLTADYAHSGGVNLLPNWPRSSVLLTVNGGQYSATRTSEEYALYENGSRVRSLGRIGFEGQIELEGDSFVIDVEGEFPGFPIPLDSDSTIYFDNDCVSRNNDFYMLYRHVIYDPSGKEFVINLDRGDLIPTDETQNERKLLLDALPCNNFRVTKLFQGIIPTPSNELSKPENILEDKEKK
jgi:hypothetical protein